MPDLRMMRGCRVVAGTSETGHGDGTFTQGANLSLAIPATAPAGRTPAR